MFGAAPTAIMLVDRDGQDPGSRNRSAESMFGYSEQEMIGQAADGAPAPTDVDRRDAPSAR
jgi:PAS domain S-box-containing protein